VEVHSIRDMTLTSNQTEKDQILLGLGIINGMNRIDTITIPMLKNLMDRMGGKDALMKIIKDLVDSANPLK
jgi:hypothetical protein